MRKLAYLFVCLLALPATGQTWSGSGTPNDPYQIWDACDMQAIGANSVYWDAHFVLCADINLAEYTGTSFNIIGTWSNPFTGVFDGNGHTISNFTYTITYATGEYCKGLFGEVDSATAEIKDLGLVGHKIIGNWRSYYVGSLVGKLENGIVTSCYAEGGNTSGGDIIGGLVGRSVNGLIYNCYATGRVTTYSTGDWGTGDGGGLVAVNSGTISNCYAKVKLSGRNYGAIGGLVGFNYNGYISNCYATGSVGSAEDVGGLVGINYSGMISNCYATGRVSGRTSVPFFYTGGLVGFSNGTVNASFWDVNTSGEPNSDGGTGLTTTEMQDANTFIVAGWDFNTPVWKFCSVPNYPSLWWECPVLEPEELIAELLEDVGGLELPSGIENSLMAKLNSALGALEDENENNDIAAINTLGAFINAVEAQRGKKISEAEADALIAEAQQIIDLLSDE